MSSLFGPEERGACLSPDLKYRYALWRTVGENPDELTFVMLNPSTADADVDDMTIRRCMGFARALGYGKMSVVNLFAYRTPYPAALKRLCVHEAYGPDNTAHLTRALTHASHVVCAWGSSGGPMAKVAIDAFRDLAIQNEVRLWCLALTNDGYPRHPSRLPNGLKLQEFSL